MNNLVLVVATLTAAAIGAAYTYLLMDRKARKAQVKIANLEEDVAQTRQGFVYLSDAHQKVQDALARTRLERYDVTEERDRAHKLLQVILGHDGVAAFLRGASQTTRVLATFREPA